MLPPVFSKVLFGKQTQRGGVRAAAAVDMRQLRRARHLKPEIVALFFFVPQGSVPFYSFPQGHRGTVCSALR